jgi:hypothetical protein
VGLSSATPAPGAKPHAERDSPSRGSKIHATSMWLALIYEIEVDKLFPSADRYRDQSRVSSGDQKQIR